MNNDVIKSRINQCIKDIELISKSTRANEYRNSFMFLSQLNNITKIIATESKNKAVPIDNLIKLNNEFRTNKQTPQQISQTSMKL